MKKVLVIVLVFSLLAISGLALAQGWGRGPGGGNAERGPGYGPGGNCAAGLQALNLGPDQSQQMQALRENHFKEIAPLRDEMVSKRGELRALWAQTNPDQSQILAKQQEMNKLRSQLQEKATNHRLDLLQILTPEQKAKFQAFSGPGMRWASASGPGYGMGRCCR